MDEKKNWEKIKTGNVVAVIVVVFCLFFPVLLIFFEVPPSNKDIFNYLTGSIYTTVLGGVVFYLFNYKKKEES